MTQDLAWPLSGYVKFKEGQLSGRALCLEFGNAGKDSWGCVLATQPSGG